jgi:hypothetical protein
MQSNNNNNNNNNNSARDGLQVVQNIAQTDILLGRGAFCINHIGNVMFQDFCAGKRDGYNSTTNRKRKKDVVEGILNAIYAKGGRFLRSANETELVESGALLWTRGWVLADHKSILLKIKQILREKEYIPKVKSTHQHLERVIRDPFMDHGRQQEYAGLAQHLSSPHGSMSEYIRNTNRPTTLSAVSTPLYQSLQPSGQSQFLSENNPNTIDQTMVMQGIGRSDDLNNFNSYFRQGITSSTNDLYLNDYDKYTVLGDSNTRRITSVDVSRDINSYDIPLPPSQNNSTGEVDYNITSSLQQVPLKKLNDILPVDTAILQQSIQGSLLSRLNEMIYTSNDAIGHVKPSTPRPLSPDSFPFTSYDSTNFFQQSNLSTYEENPSHRLTWLPSQANKSKRTTDHHQSFDTTKKEPPKENK